MASSITINGIEYKVLQYLGKSDGFFRAIVKMPNGTEREVVSKYADGPYSFPKEKMKPVIIRGAK